MFKSDKVILTRCSDFIGQVFACNAGLFVLNATCDYGQDPVVWQAMDAAMSKGRGKVVVAGKNKELMEGLQFNREPP